LNFDQIFKTLIRLNLISQFKEESESSINKMEKALARDLYEEIKHPDGLVTKTDFFTFILAIINLYETYLIKIHKNTIIEEGPIAEESKAVDINYNEYDKKDANKEKKKE